ncbi:tRNA lysidine(34) synthetase TilS [Luteolibacter sp. SL250]|uniref:tRNA lysidine(34) synthetase TilS n=1 Tax=Luteolibacter sp. SL250 TaxID=2995170 RepID=UPI0022716960|nr:tRNA lysidine(34) synthetase TilS [Luteolibacter sp. SL250]WAC21862.1 tRNA lysidine(34) synthetase TilS [Luteolibacter sp. SL250]
MSWFGEASKRRKWLVAVSGGADSVALLHLLLREGFRNLVVCHVDHRLRGRASTGDAAFVKRLADRLGLPGETARVDVRRLAEERRESLETAARNARHEFFRECAARHRCNRVLLAHHADDQAETILWNLLRGSHGPKGMKEIQEVKGLEFHRPLLGWRRKQLREWLSSNQLKWREDATNDEPLAVRNRLRNEVFPLLDEIGGRDGVGSFIRLLEDFAEISSVTEFALKQVDILDPQNRVHLLQFKKLPPALQGEVLARYLVQHGIAPSRDLLKRSLEMIDGSASSVNLPGGKRLRRRAGRLFVE